MDQTLIIIPWWFKDAVENSRISFNSLFDYRELKKYFSIENLVELVKFQDNKNYNSVDNYVLSNSSTLLDVWYKSIETENLTINKLKEEINNIKFLSNIKEETTNLVVSEKENNRDKSSYKIQILNRNYILLFLEDIHCNRIHDKNVKFQLLSGLLNVAYTLNTFNSVNKSFLFTNYLNQLSNLIRVK